MSIEDWDASERLRIRAEQAVSAIKRPELTKADENADPNPADIGPPDIDRLIDDGFDPQLELALILLQTQVLAETPSDTSGDPRRVAGGTLEDLRSRAGGR